MGIKPCVPEKQLPVSEEVEFHYGRHKARETRVICIDQRGQEYVVGGGRMFEIQVTYPTKITRDSTGQAICQMDGRWS
jgi:hypothetical protein